MNYKLRALIKIDLEDRSAGIHVTGCFTSTNYRALVPVIRRAYALPGHPEVTVDISRAKHVDPSAAALLEAACAALSLPSPTRVIRIIKSEHMNQIASVAGLVPGNSASVMSQVS
jgi:anti-anti-sigma regulatory factor